VHAPVAARPVALMWILEYACHFSIYRVIDAFAFDKHKLLRAALQEALPEDQERMSCCFSSAMLFNFLRNPTKLRDVAVADIMTYMECMVPATLRLRTFTSPFFCVATQLRMWLTLYFARVDMQPHYEAALALFFPPEADARTLFHDERDGKTDFLAKARLYARFRAEVVEYHALTNITHAAKLRVTPQDVAAARAKAAADHAQNPSAPGPAQDRTVLQLEADLQRLEYALPRAEEARRRAVVIAERHGRDMVLSGIAAMVADLREERGWDVSALDAAVETTTARARATADAFDGAVDAAQSAYVRASGDIVAALGGFTQMNGTLGQPK